MVREMLNSSDDREAGGGLLERVPCGICRLALDQDFTILEANRFYYGIYGYTKPEAEHAGFTNARAMAPAEDFERIYSAVKEITATGQKYFEMEYRGFHRSGAVIWLLARCVWDVERPGELLCAVLDIAERRQAVEHLRLSLKESKLAFQLTGKIIYTFDVRERRLFQPAEMAELFGLPEIISDMPDSVIAMNAIADESVEEYRRFYWSMIRGLPSGRTVVKRRKKNGEFCWYEAQYTLIYGSDGGPEKGIIACEDVTSQHEKEQAYQKWSQYFSAKKDDCVGCYEYNLTQNCLEESVGECEIAKRLKKYTETGVYIAERLIAEEDRSKFYRFYNREKMLVRFYEGQRKLSLEYRRRGRDTLLHWIRADVLLTTDPYNGDVKMFLTLRDIDDKKREESALRRKLETDQLTGLLNRSALIDRISEILDRRDFSIRHALIMLDIDHFKELNDGYGHQFGDLVLADTAALLKAGIRKGDLCGRLGGDEFILFLDNITSEKEVERRIGKLCQSLNRRYRGVAKVSSSLGVSFYPRDGVEFSQMYRNADAALYEAKKAGRAQYVVYKGEN